MAGLSSRSFRGSEGSYLDFHPRTNLRELLDQLSEFDKKLATQLRASLKASGDLAIDEMREILRRPSPGVVTGFTLAKTRGQYGTGQLRWRRTEVHTRAAASSRTRGSRSGIAAGLKVSLSSGRTARQSVVLMAPGDPFSRSYNMTNWRHPIRHNPAVVSAREVPWVEQGGRPYFGQAVHNHYRQIYDDVDQAIRWAIDQVETHGAMTDL